MGVGHGRHGHDRRRGTLGQPEFVVAGLITVGGGIGTKAASYGIDYLYQQVCQPPPPVVCPGTAPSTSLKDYVSGSANAARMFPAQNTPPTITGMGSKAPPVGGPGCGDAPAPAPASVMAAQQSSTPFVYDYQAGRVAVRVGASGGGSFAPFSGVTDAAGYFFLPEIPAGQPFTAIAFDTLTGETRTTQGVGPPLGDAVTLFFDFFHPDNSTPALAFGAVVTGTVAGPAQVSRYAVDVARATPCCSACGRTTPRRSSPLPWSMTKTAISSAARAQARVSRWNAARLAVPGKYTIVVSDRSGDNAGGYHLYLDRLNHPVYAMPLALGEIVSGTTTLPRALDIYTLTAAAGEPVLLRLQDTDPSSFYPNVRIYSLNKIGVYDDCSPSLGGPALREIDCTLGNSDDGSYAIFIDDDSSTLSNTGSYSLYVQRLAVPRHTTPLAFGKVVTATIPMAVGLQAYTFTGAPSDQVTLTVASVTGASIFSGRIYLPDGTPLCGHNGVITLTLPCTLDGTGTATYTIFAGYTKAHDTGTFTVKLEK